MYCKDMSTNMSPRGRTPQVSIRPLVEIDDWFMYLRQTEMLHLMAVSLMKKANFNKTMI